jgi:hypothetical protein
MKRKAFLSSVIAIALLTTLADTAIADQTRLDVLADLP